MSVFKVSQPGISIFSGHVLPSKAVFLPRLECVLAEGLALFFTLNKLGDRFTHQPVWSALARISQTLYASLDVLTDLDRYRTSSRSGHVDFIGYL